MSERKLLVAAVLTEEDEFYAECNVARINLIDRVNGKPVRVYPYWIDRANCNWHSPPVAEDEEVDEVEDDDVDESEDEYPVNRKGLIGRLTSVVETTRCWTQRFIHHLTIPNFNHSNEYSR